MHRWHATYHWKDFDKGYNFSLNFTSIRGLHKNLWAFQVAKVPILRISKLSTWESRDKMTFGCSHVINQKEYYKKEATKSKPWWILWIRVCLWLVYAQKMFQLRINQFVVWFVQVHVNSWPACHSFYSPSRSSNTPLLPPPPLPLKCYELKNILNFFFCCFHFWTRIWVF